LSIESFVLVLCVGAALLAFWFAVRFPDTGPNDMTRSLLHVVVAFLLLQLIVWAMGLVSGVSVPVARFIDVFGLVLPSLTYIFLAAAWFIRAAAGSLNSRY
jgi:hypothetical protein